MIEMEEYTDFDGEKERQDELGAFFTPEPLVKKMYENITDFSGDFFDPCAGEGNLLVYALNKKIENEEADKAITEIYGCELDKDVYSNLVKKMSDWAEIHKCKKSSIDTMKKHFVNGDFLLFRGFDDNGNSLGFTNNKNFHFGKI
jgi:hypothetical protein